MPMHRRRVYLEHGATRKARMERWFYLSIFLSAAILMLSLVVCLPDIISSIRELLLPPRRTYQFGASHTQQASALILCCEILTAVSAAYLAVALFIRSNSR